MRFFTVFLLIASAAWGESLMSGTSSSNGVSVELDTRLEPGEPPITKHGGGTLTEKEVIKRHIGNFDNQTYFGYDLTLERLANGKVRMRFTRLTMTPKQMTQLFKEVRRWTPLAPPKGELATLEVRPGETVALDLFVNPRTGQKVTEYLTVK
jgi:hypothetical protein